ncbi:MAG: DUF433 domain-containing protein [Nostocaceae cyanobacterium]|nr:DUF433 domain-containing protein [Nostocaceae cyanobacterium]
MPVDWRDYITSTPDILRGKPRIKGTRISVSLVLGYLATGQTHSGNYSGVSGLIKITNRCLS